ncbi:MAG TPA: hypothetical protein VLY24_30540 [Bryobacteraceae bacterium]|nr:hypothetical protein [Bryobacteraceae bacterium]
MPFTAWAQLTTGMVEGRAAAGQSIEITGRAGFHTTLQADSRGTFTVALPYGQYQFAGVSVYVAPVQTTRVDLTAAISSQPPQPGIWADVSRGQTYPDALSYHGVLLSREPSTVTEPLDFLGLSDYRLALVSQRASSWTGTQFTLQGMDATDSYQPGIPVILPNVEAMDEIVMRGAFAGTTSRSPGSEAGFFLAEPGAQWHATLSSMDTGSGFASSNLPAPADRGLVEQPELFNWFTRDGLEVGGPLAKWADWFGSVAGQWSGQTVPLTAPGNEQRARQLFANTRGRVRASDADQLEAEYVGSRVDLSDWGVPAGFEALSGDRLAPSYVLPGGLPGEAEVDHLDLVQAGWTHRMPQASKVGIFQVRYGYSTSHQDGLDASHGAGPQQSRIELLDGMVTGAAPLQNLAIRTRHDIETSWQPETRRTGPIEHQIVAAAGGRRSSARNRFSAPSNMNLITADGAPAYVIDFNTPLDTVEVIRSFSVYAADHMTLARTVSFDLGGLADFSRGSVQSQSGTLIAWNTFSPRAGLAWQVPHSHGLTVRGAYARRYAPLAGRYLDFGDPNGLSGLAYQWIDSNHDGWFEPAEQGPLLMRFGGRYSAISPSLHRPCADEFHVGADLALGRAMSAGMHLFRRDDENRIAALDVGVPPQDFTPVAIHDPGPDGLAGTSDDQTLTVYQQSPGTLGQDRYLLTNPSGLNERTTGFVAEVRTQWRGLTAGASFLAEKTYGPTNPGDSPWANDPGVIGALLLDPNTAIHDAGRSFFDRAYVGKVQAAYRLPWGGVELATVADYLDGLVFARQLLVTGLAQGPFLVATTVRGSPEGGNRAEHVTNWNLRARRQFRVPFGRITAIADLMNVTNAGHRIQESDLSGPEFNLRLPVALQAARQARVGFRVEF